MLTIELLDLLVEMYFDRSFPLSVRRQLPNILVDRLGNRGLLPGYIFREVRRTTELRALDRLTTRIPMKFETW